MKRNAPRTCIRGARPGGLDVGRWTYLKRSATLKVMFAFTVSPQKTTVSKTFTFEIHAAPEDSTFPDVLADFRSS